MTMRSTSGIVLRFLRIIGEELQIVCFSMPVMVRRTGSTRACRRLFLFPPALSAVHAPMMMMTVVMVVTSRRVVRARAGAQPVEARPGGGGVGVGSHHTAATDSTTTVYHTALLRAV